jgi:hypothetical protein
MGMDDAVETITQVLSLIDRTPTPCESVCPAPEYALNHTSTLIGICSQAALPREFLSVQSTAQNFRIILRSSCIVKKRPPFRSDSTCVPPYSALIPQLPDGWCIDPRRRPPMQKSLCATRFAHEYRSCSLSWKRHRRFRCDEFVRFLTSPPPSHSILPCHV